MSEFPKPPESYTQIVKTINCISDRAKVKIDRYTLNIHTVEEVIDYIERLKGYITRLETDADPAGTVQENARLELDNEVLLLALHEAREGEQNE